jgi:tetratricopeptide (TPR) repeat protein
VTQAPKQNLRRRLTADETYAAALTFHRQGRLRDAEQLYRAVLHANGAHAAALHHLGVVCSQTRRFEEAVRLIGQSVEIDPQSSQPHNDLGIALAGQGRPEQALAAYEKALLLDPGNVGAHNNLGNALLALGRPDEAVARFEQAIAVKADAPEVHNNFANALAALRRHSEAIEHYRQALALKPRFAQASNNLGLTLAALGRDEEAVARFEEAAAAEPSYAEAYANLARALSRLRRHDAAIECFQTALVIRPNDAELHNSLANTLTALNRHTEAAVQYQKAISLRPDFAEAHNNVGNALAALNRHEEAVEHFRKALALAPHLIEANTNLGASLEALDRAAEAVPCYEKVIGADPDNSRAHHRLGLALRTIGRLEEGERELEKAVALVPTKPEFLRSLAESKHFAADDPHLAAMERLARDMDALSQDDRIELHFALAKAYADLGRSEPAFQHLLLGNSLKRRQLNYDEAGTLALFRRVEAIFTPELMRRFAGGGEASAAPIFIVGMARSGSTLVEQVLASHPDVFALGEVTEFAKAVALFSASERRPFPEGLVSATSDSLRELGARYLRRIVGFAPAAQRITDKALANFLFAGLINLALPNARLIHTRRDPIDTCFSAFSKLFTAAQAHTFDLAELGRYYRGYDALMAHWRRVLPDGVMLEVQYEDLVADFEPQARRIVAHCGLQWDDRCRAFHETRRAVRTASAAQVRQPIYRSAVGRWQPYAAMLTPLIEALEGDDARP